MERRRLSARWSTNGLRDSRAITTALDLIFDNALVYVEYGKLVTNGDYLSRIKWGGATTRPNRHGTYVGPDVWQYGHRGWNLP